MRQRPGTAKGIVFITIEDEFGVANLIVYTDVGARDRAALIGARLLVAEGRIERETDHAEVPITHLICRKLIDRSDLLQRLTLLETQPAWSDAILGRADEVRRPDPGSGRVKVAGLPTSRDFR
jgi:error-prone DNA polymerase